MEGGESPPDDTSQEGRSRGVPTSEVHLSVTLRTGSCGGSPYPQTMYPMLPKQDLNRWNHEYCQWRYLQRYVWLVIEVTLDVVRVPSI